MVEFLTVLSSQGNLYLKLCDANMLASQNRFCYHLREKLVKMKMADVTILFLLLICMEKLGYVPFESSFSGKMSTLDDSVNAPIAAEL